jgi:hypothetical protein
MVLSAYMYQIQDVRIQLACESLCKRGDYGILLCTSQGNGYYPIRHVRMNTERVMKAVLTEPVLKNKIILQA